jgi:hypothetical protein
VKAAVLRGDSDCSDLVAVSIYDSKPVYFLTMAAEEIKWVECQKKVYCRETGKMESMKFLRVNINTDYNFKMNDVDCSDQLRNNYRFDHWMRKRKWWWSILFWGLGVLMVNAYVSYVEFNLSHGKKKKDLLSHYEFRCEIAKAWLDPETNWKNRDKKKPASRKRSIDSVASAESGRQTRGSTNCAEDDAGRRVTKAQRVSDISLEPRTGKLKGRLDITLGHWPTPKINLKAKCALHNWAAGIEEAGQIVCCSSCGVHLCTYCFQYFHTVENIVETKHDLMGDLIARKVKPDTSEDQYR